MATSRLRSRAHLMRPRLAPLVGAGLAVVLLGDVVTVASDAAESASARSARAVAATPSVAPSGSSSPAPSAAPRATAGPTVPRVPAGPGQILFGLTPRDLTIGPQPATVWSVAPDGRGARRRPGALPLPLTQVSRRNDLAVDVKPINELNQLYMEQGLLFRRLSTGKTRLVTQGGYDSAPSWSPDGRFVAYLSNRIRANAPAVPMIALMTAAGRDLGVLATPPQDSLDSAPVWAPNGRAIATVRYGSNNVRKVILLGLDGALLRTIATGPFKDLAWSPDGRTIVAVRARPEGTTDSIFQEPASDLWLLDVIRGGARQLTALVPRSRPGQRLTTYCAESFVYSPQVGTPVWSRDGRLIAFLSNHRHGPQHSRQSDVMVVEVRTRHVRPAYLVPRDTCSSQTPIAEDSYIITTIYGWVP